MILALLLLATLGVAIEQPRLERPTVQIRNWELEVVLPSGSMVNGMNKPYAYTGNGYCAYNTCSLSGEFYPESGNHYQWAQFNLDPSTGETFTILRESDGYRAGGIAPSTNRHVSPNGSVLVDLVQPEFRWLLVYPDGSFIETVHLGQKTEFGEIDDVLDVSFLPDESVLIVANVTTGVVNDNPYRERMILRWGDGQLSKVWSEFFGGEANVTYVLDNSTDLSNLLVEVGDFATFSPLLYQSSRLGKINTVSRKVTILSERRISLGNKVYRPYTGSFSGMVTNDKLVVMNAAAFEGDSRIGNDLLWFKDSQKGVLVDNATPQMAGSSLWANTIIQMGVDGQVVFNTTETNPDDGLAPTNLRNAWIKLGIDGPLELIAGANDHVKRPGDISGAEYTHFFIEGILDGGEVVISAWSGIGSDIVVARRLNPVINQVIPEMAEQGSQVMLYGTGLCREGFLSKAWVKGQEVPTVCRGNGRQLEITVPYLRGEVPVSTALIRPDGEMIESNTVWITVVPAGPTPFRSIRSRVGSMRDRRAGAARFGHRAFP